MANETGKQIIRQNQTQHVRELLNSRGQLNSISLYEFLQITEIFSEYCEQGLTPTMQIRLDAIETIIKNLQTKLKPEDIAQMLTEDYSRYFEYDK